LYSWNTMPICRRAWRSATPDTRARSLPSNRISPDEGSTRRLMQRISVLLPVPDGPMIAVTPSAAISTSMSCRTGLPGT